MSAATETQLAAIYARIPEVECKGLCQECCGPIMMSHRPAICRILGAVQSMACPHGCRPKKWMTKDESFDVLSATEKVNT